MNFLKSAWKKVTSVVSKPDVSEETETTTTSPSYDSKDDSPEEPECKRLAVVIKDKSKCLQTGPVSVYVVPLADEKINVSGCKRFRFEKESTKRNRTVMVLGATGAGKSTLINGMINYVVGVEWEDPFRFKLVDEGQSKSQAESQTSEVTVYKINHQEGFKINYSLTIVDTPGFGDTRGIERDKVIVEQLRNLFSAKLGVSEIDAVCFVAQASLARLTPTQKYVFDSVLSIFGKDVAENIRVLVTFADGQRPPVLEAINAAGVPCPKTADGLPVHFKFNNSALFAHNKASAAENMREDDEDGGFDEMFWNMGTKSMKRFFTALNKIETKSLVLTKNVLKQRKELEDSIENLQKKVKLGLAKLEEVKETAEQLKEHEAEASRNENYVVKIKVTKPFQVENTSGWYLTNCQQCHFTCHDSCGIPNDADKHGCWAMGPDGNCHQCPKKCYWNVHFNQKYKWDYKEVMEEQTIDELKKKYLKATKGKGTVQAVVDKLKAEYDAVQKDVTQLMEMSAECLNRLKEIALKPNPLSTPEYIDMLIEGEKSEAKPGWKKRVEHLIEMRKQAEYMAKVERGENPLEGPPADKAETSSDPDQNEEQELDTNQSQDEPETNSDPEQGDPDSDTNIDQDKTENNPNVTEEENTEIDPEQDETDTNSDMSGCDQDKTDNDTKQDQTNTDQDETEADTNNDNTETSSTDQNKDQELDNNQVQDETETDQSKPKQS